MLTVDSNMPDITTVYEGGGELLFALEVVSEQVNRFRQIDAMLSASIREKSRRKGAIATVESQE